MDSGVLGPENWKFPGRHMGINPYSNKHLEIWETKAKITPIRLEIDRICESMELTEYLHKFGFFGNLKRHTEKRK